MSKKIAYFLLFLFLFPVSTLALSGRLGISSESQVVLGNEIVLTMYIDNIETSSGVVGLEANLSFDHEYLEYVSGLSEEISPSFTFQINPSYNYKIAGLDTSLSSGIKTKTNIFTFRFVALKTGQTEVTLKNSKISDAEGNKITPSVASKTISITNKKSTNAYLSYLDITDAKIEFNKNITTYTTSVDASVKEVNISAKAEDGSAKVTGVGTKNLNYGNNVFKIVVESLSGVSKTYTININRIDDRSNNAFLKDLTIENFEINFDREKVEYDLFVPYTTSKLSISATQEDVKSKVTVTNPTLEQGKTTNVVIKVEAQDESTKTYIIHVTRGVKIDDLSSNNYLKSITISDGELSPKFSQEQMKYVVYLPYETSAITVTVDLEDLKANIIKSEPSTLSVGNNVFKYTVKAEDESVRTYEIIVVRGKNVLDENSSLDAYLTNIDVVSGRLNSEFDPETFNYTYKKNSEIEINPEGDEESNITVIENDGVISILVENSKGEFNVYTITPKTSSTPLVVGTSAGGIGGGIVISAISRLLKSKKFRLK